MKKITFACVMAMLFSGCGYTSKDNDLIGQVKKYVHVTPLICPNRYDVDMSLGVMRNGVGSMSSDDVWATVSDAQVLADLKLASESGKLVKVAYDVRRLVFCQNDHEITHVEILDK